MSVKTWSYVHGVHGNANRNYICDTEAELPVSDLIPYGDTAYTKDTKKLWIAATSTTWEEQSPGSGGSTHDILSATHTDSLAASVTRGALIVGNSTPKWSSFAIGGSNTVLTSNGTDPAWSGTPAVTSITLSGLTAGRIVFTDTGGLLATDSGLTWDNTNKKATITGTLGAQQRWAYNGSNYVDVTATSLGVWLIEPSGGIVAIEKDRAGLAVTLGATNFNAAANSGAELQLVAEGGSAFITLVSDSSGAGTTWQIVNSNPDSGDPLKITANATEVLRITTAGSVTSTGSAGGTFTINSGMVDYDTIISSDNITRMLSVDASADRVGVTATAPETTFHVATSGNTIFDSLRIHALFSGGASGSQDGIGIENAGAAAVSSSAQTVYYLNRTTGGRTSAGSLRYVADDVGNTTFTSHLSIYTSLNASLTERWQVVGSGGLVSVSNLRFAHGTSALSTSATEGFLFIQSCAGTPTGTPASIPSGQIPLVWDSTNNILYAYDAGWVSTAAGGSVSGSGAADRLAIWSGASTLTSDADIKFTVSDGVLRINSPTDPTDVGPFGTLIIGSYGMQQGTDGPCWDDTNKIGGIAGRSGVSETAFTDGMLFRIYGGYLFEDISSGSIVWRMIIAVNGNVNIGMANSSTKTPQSKLEVTGNALIGPESWTGTGGISAPTNGLIVQGNVGIGSYTGTLAKLHVAKDATTDSGVQVYITGETNENRRLQIGYNTTSNYGVIQANENGTSTRHLILQPSGSNVGIGIGTPDDILHIYATNPYLRIESNGTGANGIKFELNNTVRWTVGNPSGDAALMFYYEPGPFEAARFTTAGDFQANRNVGVGGATDFGGGVGVLGIKEVTTAPTAAPASGIIIWFEGDLLKMWASNGKLYTLEPVAEMVAARNY